MLGGGVLLGCPSPQPRPRPEPERAADKAALFGDPALVPTRDGERARREIASAEELRKALELLHAVERARVSIELDDDGHVKSGIVVGRARTRVGLDELRDQVGARATAMLGDTLSIEVSAPDHATTASESPGEAPRLRR